MFANPDDLARHSVETRRARIRVTRRIPQSGTVAYGETVLVLGRSQEVFMRFAQTLIGCLLFDFLAIAVTGAEPTSTVELRVGNDVHVGRVAARTSQQTWLMQRNGQLREIELSRVKSFKQVSPKFSPLTPMMLSTDLKREFGADFETATTRHYVVVATKGKSKQYVELFESVYRTFHTHFSVHGFEIDEPEFPLIAVIFPNQAAFAKYANQEGVQIPKGLTGYYRPMSNRVALFEDGAARPTAHRDAVEGEIWLGKSPRAGDLFGSPRDFGTIEADIRDTIIHECTHQVAFNVGMHDRMGDNPQWVVEGLATVFEAPGIRNRANGTQVIRRINPDRFAWFKEFAKTRRKKDSLETFIGGDELFQSNTLDAYAQAWALSFFLMETRPRKYAEFLKQTAEQGDRKSLTREKRVGMFQTAFGSDRRLFEAEFLRFYEKLK